MDKLSFVIIFISVVLGFNVSEYLKGLSNLIKRRSKINFYLPHTIWMILILLLLVQWWWGAWLYADRMEENLGFFLLILCIPIVFFLSIMLLLPTSEDLKKYKGSIESFFHDDSSYFYSTIIFLFFIYELTGVYFLKEPFLSVNVGFRALVVLVCLAAIFKKNKLFDYISSIATLLILMYFYWIRFT